MTNAQTVVKQGHTKMESIRIATLGSYVAKAKALDPRKFPDEEFELFSVPSHAEGKPEVVVGKTVGASKQMVEDDTVLLCKINPRINRVWVVSSHTKHKKIASSEWMTFPPSPDFLPQYLGYYLQQDELRDHLALNASGVGGSLMRAKPGLVKDFPFPLFPLPQQRRIVEAIELQLGRLDAAVARLQGAKARLKRYKQAVLKAAFAETESGFDDGWQELTIGDVARRIVVGYVGPMTEFIVESDGIPLLSTTHIGENEFLDKESRQVTRAFHEKNKKSRVAPGDILIARHGDSGKACIVPGHVMEAQVSNAVILSVDSASALPEYVCYRINFERTVMQEARVGGVLQVVNTKTMEAFPLRVPSLESQRRIVERVKQQLAATDETETTLDAQLQQAVRLRQAVLKRAFEGRMG